MAQAKKRKENGEGVSGTLKVPHTDTGTGVRGRKNLPGFFWVPQPRGWKCSAGSQGDSRQERPSPWGYSVPGDLPGILLCKPAQQRVSQPSPQMSRCQVKGLQEMCGAWWNQGQREGEQDRPRRRRGRSPSQTKGTLPLTTPEKSHEAVQRFQHKGWCAECAEHRFCVQSEA